MFFNVGLPDSVIGWPSVVNSRVKLAVLAGEPSAVYSMVKLSGQVANPVVSVGECRRSTSASHYRSALFYISLTASLYRSHCYKYFQLPISTVQLQQISLAVAHYRSHCYTYL